MTDTKLKVAFIGTPYVGGNYTHFKYLSDGLPEYSWTLLQMGKSEAKFLEDEKFILIGDHLDRKKDSKKLAKELLSFLSDNQYDILIPMNSGIAISVIPFLPQSIKIVNIVNSDTPRVYKAVSEHFNYISKIICISPKQVSVLKAKNNIKKKLQLIPHAVKIQNESIAKKSNLIKIGFLGRIHNEHKGVLLIPKILHSISEPFVLEVVGDGADKDTLISELEKFNVNYFFYGTKNGTEKENIIAQWDLMLFPSYIEGFGLTLIEVMQYGVIPIANEIKGITDYIIKDSVNGFIIPQNDTEKFSQIIQYLFNNPNEKLKIAEAAKKTIVENFNMDIILQDYKRAFKDARDYEKPNTLDFSNWVMYKEYCPSLLSRIISKIKILLKKRF